MSSEDSTVRFNAREPQPVSAALSAMPSNAIPTSASGMRLSIRRLCRQDLPRYIEETYGLTYSVAWFAKLAVTGGGPPFVKSGRRPMYDPADVDDWIASRTSGLKYSTSDRGR